jgi:hypothetical protein
MAQRESRAQTRKGTSLQGMQEEVQQLPTPHNRVSVAVHTHKALKVRRLLVPGFQYPSNPIMTKHSKLQHCWTHL